MLITREDYPPDRPFSAAKKHAVQELLIAAALDEKTKPRRKLRLVITSVGIVGAVGGGGAIAYSAIDSNSVTDQSQARCYTVAEYGSGKTFPGTSIAEADSATTTGRVSSAIDVCADLWRAGLLQAGAPGPIRSPAKAVYPVPALVSCILPSGQAAVFPGTNETCEGFKLVTFASRPASP